MEIPNLRIDLKQKKQLLPEHFFLIIILIFGCLSAFTTFPLANGDEGFHLAKSYSLFSKNQPSSMEVQAIRELEVIATAPHRESDSFNITSFYIKKLPDVKNDGLTFNLQKDNNSTLKIDIAHIPPAIGVLIGRIIYPSYGVMLLCSRIANLAFFAICLFFVIKYSKVGKWSLFMLFSVPFMQKIASPSYDVFAYVAICAFAVNILSLAKLKTFKDLHRNQIMYTLFTIILILLAKNNYVFALLSLFILPLFLNPVFNSYKRLKKQNRIIFWLLSTILIISLLFFANEIFGISHFIKLFFNSYFNVATMGRRGKSIFSVVSTILPDMFNVLWIVSIFFVMIGEEKYNWDIIFVIGSVGIFFLNWLGIFAGFYLILKKPEYSFDELSGRYLHPYIIFFLPLTQYLSYRYNLKVSTKAIQTVAISITILILSIYLFVSYYRGYIIRVTPTWIS